MIESSRRGFLTGLIAFSVTAPAIVRATSLMPVKKITHPSWDEIVRTTLRNRTPELQESLMRNNALLLRLRRLASEAALPGQEPIRIISARYHDKVSA